MTASSAGEPDARRSGWRRPGVLVLLALPLHALVLALLSLSPGLVESVYGQGLYPLLTLLRLPLDSTPLSPAVTIGVILLGTLYWRSQRDGEGPLSKKTWRAYGWRVGVALAVLLHLFPLSWGLNYLRPSAVERLGLELRAEPAAFRVTAGKVVLATNVARREWEPMDLAQLDALVDRAVRHLLEELELDEVAHPRRIRLLPTGLLMSGGWHGVTIPFTTEGMVDQATEPRYMPHAIAHEKIHQAGFARESDANFLAWLALVRSGDARLRYSTLVYVVDLFLEMSDVPLQEQVVQDLTQAVATEQAVEVPVVAEATHQVYDAYLKVNQVEAGLADYDRVAEAIHAWLEAHPQELTD